MLNTLWSICERWEIPIALGKGQLGQDVTIIGFRFLAGRSNRFKLTDNKVDLLKEWFTRLRGLRGSKVDTEEYASLAGTLVWARSALPLAGKFIRRMFALSNRPERANYQPGWFRHDLQCIEDVLEADRGARMIARPPPPSISHPTNIQWTDACREPGGYSGMGGFSPKGGGLLWYYEFDQVHVDHLPIHCLEAVAEVCGLALVAGASATDAPPGSPATALNYCDNMSWVMSVEGNKPTDPRLREILQVRHAVQDRVGLTAHIDYVNTKVNTVADLVSRGDLELALEKLERHHWDRDSIRVVDLKASPEQGPPDLKLLLDRCVQLTRARDLTRTNSTATSSGKAPKAKST